MKKVMLRNTQNDTEKKKYAWNMLYKYYLVIYSNG